MATINDLLAAIQNGVQSVNNLASSFPPITNVSTTTPGGVGSVVYNSSQIVAFGTVRTSSGGVYKIALLSGN